MSTKDPHLPASLRLDFVKKVYGILIAMLVVSFAIVAPFVYNTASTLAFMKENSWIMAICMVLLAAHQALNMALSCEACVGGSSFMQAYLRMFKTVPWNYVFLFTYATCFGVVLGFISCQYKASSVGCVFFMTAGIMAGLTAYAVYTETDFTGLGMYLFAAMMGFFLFIMVLGIFPAGPVIHKAVAALGAVLFSFVIIFDTQLIFGSVRQSFNNHGLQKIEFTVDMYAFAAYQLYLDFLNMFIYLLQLFGQRRDE